MRYAARCLRRSLNPSRNVHTSQRLAYPRIRTLTRCNEPSTPRRPPPAPPPSFPAAASKIVLPEFRHVPPSLRAIQSHLHTSFLPANQPCQPQPTPTRTVTLVSGGTSLPEVLRAQEQTTRLAPSEAVIALVTPFEGGDCYVADAVEVAAGSMEAEVQRLDIALAVGFDGAAAPLGPGESVVLLL